MSVLDGLLLLCESFGTNVPSDKVQLAFGSTNTTFALLKLLLYPFKDFDSGRDWDPFIGLSLKDRISLTGVVGETQWTGQFQGSGFTGTSVTLSRQ